MFSGIFDIIAYRRAARGARVGTFGQTAFAVLALVAGGFCTLAFADKAAAQQPPQTSISYTAEPAGLVSVNAEGRLIVLSQSAAGLMTATISGVGFTLTNGAYVRTGYSGERFVTLRFLTSCNVKDGCDVFGLPTSETVERRRNMFREMSLTTLSMFVASGADPNEIIVGNSRSNYLLYQLARLPQTARFEILLSAGADVNARAGTNNGTLLDFAATFGEHRVMSVLLTAGADVHAVNNLDQTALHNVVIGGDAVAAAILIKAGINVNATDNLGETALDRTSFWHIRALASNNARRITAYETLGTIIRNAGGRCIAEAENAAAVPICGAAQQPPNIALPNNANKTFIIRSANLNTPAVIGNLSTQ
ncbi:MAG: ankyrin repeat domain-containing protein [Gammaproteobacteria bacterium]